MLRTVHSYIHCVFRSTIECLFVDRLEDVSKSQACLYVTGVESSFLPGVTCGHFHMLTETLLGMSKCFGIFARLMQHTNMH